MRHMKATQIFRVKYEYADHAIVEMVIWSVPTAVAGSRHRYKYRLYYGKGGRRIVGYDNERGKGDHRRVRGRERPYRFRSPGRLIADFLADVDDARKTR
jgi:hypothetical protein